MIGRIVLMGSGETAPTMVATHRDALQAADADAITILDTPFGFQENAEPLTERLAAFFRTSLVVDAEVASLRRADAPPAEVERMLSAVRRSRAVFAGPGSPSYAMSVWGPTDLSRTLAAMVSAGGSVVLASAAALTAGVATIPVYEIYKVGRDPHWIDGLDLTSSFGIPMVVVPHWNNAEGGDHDTSRCYIGRRRLSVLERSLDVGILGVDEHTAATLDFGSGTLSVTGKGTVTLRGQEERILETGTTLDLDVVAELLGAAPPGSVPVPKETPVRDLHEALASRDGDAALAVVLDAEERASDDAAARSALRSMIVTLSDAARDGLDDPRDRIEGFVLLLLDLRERARSAGRYDEADSIRDGLASLGVEVRDTGAGVEWHLAGGNGGAGDPL